MLAHQEILVAKILEREAAPFVDVGEQKIESNFGYVCDPHGTGKTRTMLEVIKRGCTNLHTMHDIVHQITMEPDPSFQCSITERRTNHFPFVKATLIVVPERVFSTVWIKEIRSSGLVIEEGDGMTSFTKDKLDEINGVLCPSKEIEKFATINLFQWNRVIVDSIDSISHLDPKLEAGFLWCISTEARSTGSLRRGLFGRLAGCRSRQMLVITSEPSVLDEVCKFREYITTNVTIDLGNAYDLKSRALSEYTTPFRWYTYQLAKANQFDSILMIEDNIPQTKEYLTKKGITTCTLRQSTAIEALMTHKASVLIIGSSIDKLDGLNLTGVDHVVSNSPSVAHDVASRIIGIGRRSALRVHVITVDQ